MIKIENFLANENSEFLNYRFNKGYTYFVNMKDIDIENFWNFLVENKNFSMGDLIIDDISITTNVSSSIRRTVLDKYTFFVDDGLWYRKKTPAFKLFKELCNFKNIKKKDFSNYKKWMDVFGVQKYTLERPYEKLSDYEKISLDLILMIIVNKPYNFYYLPKWNEYNDELKTWIKSRLDMVSTETKQTFIFVTKQNNDNLLDLNNELYTTSNEITIFSDDFKERQNAKKVVVKKRNEFKSFFKLSKIILSMFRMPYAISMSIMFVFLFIAMLMIYSTDKIWIFTNSKYLIWTAIALAFSTLFVFNGWCAVLFKKYKQFVKTQPIPIASKITYFYYTNLMISFFVLIAANLSAWCIAYFVFQPVMTNIYVTYAIFINLGFIIINLVLLALWILLYNSNNFKHSLRR